MKHRAKCTKCISQIMNTYNYNKHPLIREGDETYIEVATQYEAYLIESLNRTFTEAIQIYQKITQRNQKQPKI